MTRASIEAKVLAAALDYWRTDMHHMAELLADRPNMDKLAILMRQSEQTKARLMRWAAKLAEATK